MIFRRIAQPRHHHIQCLIIESGELAEVMEASSDILAGREAVREGIRQFADVQATEKHGRLPHEQPSLPDADA